MYALHQTEIAKELTQFLQPIKEALGCKIECTGVSYDTKGLFVAAFLGDYHKEIRIFAIDDSNEYAIKEYVCCDILYLSVEKPMDPGQTIQDYIKENFIHQAIAFL